MIVSVRTGVDISIQTSEGVKKKIIELSIPKMSQQNVIGQLN